MKIKKENIEKLILTILTFLLIIYIGVGLIIFSFFNKDNVYDFVNKIDIVSILKSELGSELNFIENELEVEYLKEKEKYNALADKVLYTGMIDEYFNYCLGNLEYRTLKFETELLEYVQNYQGNSVINYTDRETPYTRIIEHKHFEFGNQKDTVITREYPCNWSLGDEAYYPVNDDKNNLLFEQYKELCKKEDNIIFGGRLGNYKYYDMDKVIAAALALVNIII